MAHGLGIRGIVFRVCVAICFPAFLFAQAMTGAITGQVDGPHGVHLDGAKVVVTNAVTKKVVTVMSDANGKFVLEGLPPGQYQAEISAVGLLPKSYKIVVVVEDVRNIHAHLKAPPSSRKKGS